MVLKCHQVITNVLPFLLKSPTFSVKGDQDIKDSETSSSWGIWIGSTQCLVIEVMRLIFILLYLIVYGDVDLESDTQIRFNDEAFVPACGRRNINGVGKYSKKP